MRSFKTVLLALMFTAPALAQKTSGPSTITSVNEVHVKQDTQILGAAKYASSELEADSHYATNLKMREERRIGVGTQVGGGLGVAGLNIEINVDSENSAMAGAGAGTGYGTFQLLWRHSFEGRYFTPYTTAGWSRWYNSDSATEYKKSLILDRALSDEQKETGRFGVDFLTVSAGMQYQQLSGDLNGISFYAEFAMLSALRSPSLIPTGSLGAIYYF
jgi:hypothetical protein